MNSKSIKRKAKAIWEIESNKEYSNEKKMELIAKIIESCSEYNLYKIDEYIIEHYAAKS